LIHPVAGNPDLVTTTSRPAPRAPGGGEPARARRWSARALLAAAGVFTAAVPLTVLAVLVREKSPTLRALDHDISGSAHGFVLARPWLAEVLNVGSVVLHPRVMWAITGITAVVLWRRGRRRHAVWAVVTVAVGATLDTPLKELFARARPVFDVPVATAPGYSFPSGHALNTMIVGAGAVILGWSATRSRPPARAALLAGATALVLVTGFDRVGLGVHYPSDVVGGWLIGLATVLVTTAAFSIDLRPVERDQGESPTPESAAPDSAAPDSAAPDSAAPDSAAPDSAAPDSAAPDSAAPDSAAPDSPERTTP
jgi:undecaprenyl-diphosphatase